MPKFIHVTRIISIHECNCKDVDLWVSTELIESIELHSDETSVKVTMADGTAYITNSNYEVGIDDIINHDDGLLLKAKELSRKSRNAKKPQKGE